MAPELHILVAAVGLGFIHIVLASHAASLQRGYRWTASARDEPVEPLTGLAGRLDRASRNFAETFPFFAVSALLAGITGTSNILTLYGACAYIGARVIYAVLYAASTYLWRSLVWNVATLGIFAMLVGLYRQ